MTNAPPEEPAPEPARTGASRPTIAVVGAGRLGRVLARLAVHAGYRVLLAGSGPARGVRWVADVFAPGAEPATVRDAAREADVVLLAIPLGAVDELDPADLDGRVVLDAMNYWPETDGERPELEDPARPTSALVQARLPGARVVKAFNHVGYHDLAERSRPTGAANRTAIGVAGDAPDAVDTVVRLVDGLGFDPVVVGPLAASGVLEPRSPLFGMRLDAIELRERLARLGG